MQHYMALLANVDPGQVKIYAPFDGYVLGNSPFTLVDEGVTMVPASGIPWWPFNQWRFAMNHTYVLPEYQDPPIHFVTAGTHVGYVNARDRYGQRNKGTQVRIGVTAIPPMFKNGNGEPYKKLDSVFHSMSDEVFLEYKEAMPGLGSREDMIIPRRWRETHPCEFTGAGPNFALNHVLNEDKPLEEQNVYVGIGVIDAEKFQKKLWSCNNPDVVNKPVECFNEESFNGSGKRTIPLPMNIPVRERQRTTRTPERQHVVSTDTARNVKNGGTSSGTAITMNDGDGLA